MASESLSAKLEGEFTSNPQLVTPGKDVSAKPLPLGKDAVGGGSGFPSSVAVPATSPGEIKDVPERKEGIKQNEKVVTESKKE